MWAKLFWVLLKKTNWEPLLYYFVCAYFNGILNKENKWKLYIIFEVLWKSNAIFIIVLQHPSFGIDRTSRCFKSLMQTLITSAVQCFVVMCFLMHIRFLCKHVPVEEYFRDTVSVVAFQSPQVGCNSKPCPARLILWPEPMTAIRRSVGKRSAEHDFNPILCQFLWMSGSKDDFLWGQGRKGHPCSTEGGWGWATQDGGPPQTI